MKEIQRILEQRNIGFRDEVVANCVRELVRGTEPVGRFTLDVDTKKECYQDGEGFQFPVYRITVKLIEEGENTNGAKD